MCFFSLNGYTETFREQFQNLKTNRTEENKAYKNLYFGMSHQEVSNVGFYKSSYNQKIGGYHYDISLVFYNDMLYKIKIKGQWVNTWNAYEYDVYNTTLKEEWQNLVNVISKKYGEAAGDFPDEYSLRLEINPTHTWNLMTKTIECCISHYRSENGNIFWSILIIRHNEIYDYIQELEKKKLENKQVKDSDDF